MADITVMTVDGTTYNIKDANAQEQLTSGVNIKTINNESVLGSGNITIQGSSVTVDDALSSSSENPVQNKVINSALNSKQATLESGTNIKTINNESLLGSGNITISGISMTVLSYGHSTWDDFINAYNTNTIVYCRASSNSNPATGNQTRMAFMAYVNSTTPTEVEFQYYRSVSSHSATQQGDQVYVYKLNKTNGWSVIVRESYSKVAVQTPLTTSYSSGTITIKLPTVSASDNGKVLQVSSGAWATVANDTSHVTVSSTFANDCQTYMPTEYSELIEEGMTLDEVNAVYLQWITSLGN